MAVPHRGDIPTLGLRRIQRDTPMEVMLTARDCLGHTPEASESQVATFPLPGGYGRQMSQENVKIVRAIYAPWGRGDFSSTEWAHPKSSSRSPICPLRSAGTGLAGMAEAYRGWLSAWEENPVDLGIRRG